MTTRQALQQQFFEMLMESQFWSADELLAYQRDQLSHLLRHAKANAPFYANRLDGVVQPNGDIDWDRWRDIPIVTRRDMIERREAMQALKLPPGHGPVSVMRTSGSTGQPISVTVNAAGGIAQAGFRWRVHEWQQLDWARTLCSALGDEQHAETWPEGEPLGFWGPPWTAEAKLGGAWKVSRAWLSGPLLAFMAEHRCAYLNTGPRTANVNAHEAVRLGIDIKIDAVLAQGNVVHDSDRDIVKRVFGGRLIEHYSSKEAGQIAHPCPHDRLHVNVEGCLLEVVDDDGEPVRPGETGRVIVTPFMQTAQPLIRYEQGDLATLGRPCSCGRQSPTLEAVLGRSMSIFRHPDGRTITKMMPEVTATLLNCSYFQLAQVAPNGYELRYVPRDWDEPIDESEVARLFRQLYFDDAELRFVRRQTVIPRQGGKLVEYVNEWAAQP